MPRAWMAALCLAAAGAVPALAADRPYGVDDLLALESVGQVRFDPGERLVLVERRRRYDTAADYSYGYFVNRLLSRIDAAPLDRPGNLVPLFPQDADAGYWMGDFSPSGRRLTVFRLRQRRLDLGIVDMTTRRVVWLDVAPDLPIAHPAPGWLGEDALVAVVFRHRRLPALLSNGNALETDLPPLWAAAASGTAPTATVVTTTALPSTVGERDVVRIDLRSRATFRLATGDVTDVSVSTRGHVAIVTAVAPVRPPASPLRQTFVPLRHVLDVVASTGSSRRHIADDVAPGSMAWDDRGRRLAYVALAGPATTGAGVIVATVGSNGGTPMTVPLNDRTEAIAPHLRWAGRRLIVGSPGTDGVTRWQGVDVDRAVPSRTDLGAGDLVFADARSAWLSASDRLSRVGLARSSVTRAPGEVVGTGTVSLDPYSIGTRLLDGSAGGITAVVERNGQSLTVHPLDADGLASTSFPLPRGAMLLAVGRHHDVGFREDEHGVGTLVLACAHGREEILARINEPLAARPLPHVVRFAVKLSDGRDHDQWLFLPPHADPGRPPAVVMLVYPGMLLDGGMPAAASPAIFAPMTDVPLLVGHGVAVLMTGLPAMRDGLDPLGRLAADAEGALDAAVAHGLVDPARVAVMGHSFGGYGALALAERSTRYRGVVAVSGPYDLAAAYGQMAGPDRLRLESGLPFVSDAGWAEGGQANMGVPPWRDPARYVARSPAFALDRITTPVLLAGGETDVVSLEQAERAFMGLARLGRDATLVRYWGEGHVLASPANIRDYWHCILTWLDDRLRPAGRAITPHPNDAPTPRSSHG